MLGARGARVHALLRERLRDLVMSGRLSQREAEYSDDPTHEDWYRVLNGDPLRWAKVWSMAAQLPHFAAVFHFDYDMTVRPDRLDFKLTELFRGGDGEERHVLVRDTPTHVDCINSGFVALRNTPLGHLFLELWHLLSLFKKE